MLIDTRFIFGPIRTRQPQAPTGVGAVLTYERLVPPKLRKRDLAALVYDFPENQVRTRIDRQARRIATEQKLKGIWIEHSQRRVPAGALAARIQVSADQAANALAGISALAGILDGDLPIRTTPIWKDDADAFALEPDIDRLPRIRNGRREGTV